MANMSVMQHENETSLAVIRGFLNRPSIDINSSKSPYQTDKTETQGHERNNDSQIDNSL